MVSSDRNALIGAIRQRCDGGRSDTLACLAVRSVTRERAIRLWHPRFLALVGRRGDEKAAQIPRASVGHQLLVLIWILYIYI